MKVRLGPAAAVVLLAGRGAATWFLEFRGADERRKAEAAKDRPFAFERATLKAIVLHGAAGTIRLERDQDAWSITEPLKSPVDKDAVEGLLTSLETGRIERRLGEVADRKTYALDAPAATLTLETASGAPQALGLGDNTPIGGSFFALLPDGKEVAVVSGSIGEAAKKDLLSLRDKTILSFDPWKVTRLTIERGGETVALEKPEDGWKLVRPVEAPADGPTITDLLSAVERLRALRFVSEKAGDADLHTYGLAPPAATMTILQEGWDASRSLLFGASADGNRYARAAGRDAIVTVGADIWPKVSTSVFDLRRKEVLGVSQYRISTLTVARDGGPALVLARQKDGPWKVSGAVEGSVKNDSVDLLLRGLADLKTLAFEDLPSASRLATIAAHPSLDLTLEEEPETEKSAVRRQHLAFGPPGKDGRMPVRDLAWTPIALVDGAAVAKVGATVDALAKEAASPPAAGAGATASPPGLPRPASPPPGSPPPASPPPGGTAPGGGRG